MSRLKLKTLNIYSNLIRLLVVADTRSFGITQSFIGMLRPTNEDLDLIQSDLQTTETLRSQNFQAILYLLAENKFLKTVLIGLSAKPLDQLLREGREMIEAEFEVNEEMHERMSEIVKKLVGRR